MPVSHRHGSHRYPRRQLGALAALLAWGCDAVPADGVDAGSMPDASVVAPPIDAGALDAGPVDPARIDAATLDAAIDPGPPDAAVLPLDAGPAEEACPRVYHLAAGGDDGRDGRSVATALRSLARVQALLEADPPACDVEVHIAPGTYREQRVSWRFTMPDHRITFRAADRERRPVFDGCSSGGACPGGTFFTLRHSAGEETNLHFWYLHVRNYQTAISLNGDRNAEPASNGSNRIYGCYFERIGNVFNTSLDPSTACVRLVNSDDNEIANNHFVDVVNTRSGALIHAIYVAHMSDRNTIHANRFLRSTGDPVRVRDFSNGNVITENRFTRVGTHAGYTDWYCDHEARSDCTKPTPECPSWDNQFRDNMLDGSWSCGALGTFHYFQDDATAGCARPSAASRRLRTSGNTQTSAPCSMD